MKNEGERMKAYQDAATVSRLRNAARAWVQRALAASCPEETRADVRMLEEVCDSLVAIAEVYGVPDEMLIDWIHDESIEHTLAAFRRACERWKEGERG